jgi:hypothetical protein
LARRIDAILKLSIVMSLLFASSSVGYYYLSYLPHRDARFEPEQALQQLRAVAQRRAEREQLLLEQRVSEQRALEQQAAEQRQSQEKADCCQACLTHVTDSYNESRIAACNRLQARIIKNHDSCIRSGFREKVCNLAYVAHEPSSNCQLPRVIANNLDTEAEKARDRCLEENRVGSQ